MPPKNTSQKSFPPRPRCCVAASYIPETNGMCTRMPETYKHPQPHLPTRGTTTCTTRLGMASFSSSLWLCTALSSTKVLAAARVTWKSVLLKAVLSWRSPSLRDTIAHISYNELSMKHNRPRAQTDRDTRSHPHAHTSLHLSSIVGK